MVVYCTIVDSTFLHVQPVGVAYIKGIALLKYIQRVMQSVKPHQLQLQLSDMKQQNVLIEIKLQFPELIF